MQYNLFAIFRSDIIEICSRLFGDVSLDSIAVELPKMSDHGDLSTNAGMVLSRVLKKSPLDIAEIIAEQLRQYDYIDSVEVAKPGFINIRCTLSVWKKVIDAVLLNPNSYGKLESRSIKVNVEYVSTNPTGPVHIGHSRGAVYGDSLANLLGYAGYDVTREYYINDAGIQVQVLSKTVFLRYSEIITGNKVTIPEGYYPGEYIIDVAKAFVDKYGDIYIDKHESEYLPIIQVFAVDFLMRQIKVDLYRLGVKHDVFFSEMSLHKDNLIELAVDKLSSLGLIYKGILPKPKGQDDESDWSAREQILFRSTAYGDDQDRPLQKHDGEWTYFAGDIAYAWSKISRGYDINIVVLGSDHGGYVTRLQSVYDALSAGKVRADVKLCQLVNYFENGISIKMSKRAGTFTTVADVLNECGKDALRFMMLTRKNDAVLDFDIVKVKEQSKDNPVFYVQYAYVRCNSILANAKKNMPSAYELFENHKYNIELLSSNYEKDIIKQLAYWQRLIESVSQTGEMHKIPYYLYNLASLLHEMWNSGKDDSQYRFIVESNDSLTALRLSIIEAIRIVIKLGFDLIGIDPMETM